MRSCSSDATGPVTVTFIRGVHAAHEQEYETALQGLQKQLRAVPGYLGTEVVHDHGAHRYTSIVRFDSLARLQSWEASGQWQEWQSALAGVVTGDAEVRHAEGFEFWFMTPEQPLRAPSRHKMALTLFVVVALVSFPLSIFISAYLSEAPRLLRVLLGTAVQVGLLNYVLMPRVTRLLAAWLYSDAPPHAQPARN